LGVTHTHIARGVIDDQTIPEFMFASQTDVWQINSLSQPNRNQSSYWGYLVSGIEHILSGWDHLAFLLGLILLYQGRNLVIAITGFTIGHSLTLGLGAMNVLRVHSEMVEILIGFSILLLAVEKFFKHHYEFDKGIKHLIFASIALLPLAIFGVLEPLLILGLALFLTVYLSLTHHYSSPWIPLMITVFFGLIHGLGFASSIAEVGIPQDRLWQIILSFNLGVELGQLAVAFGILGLFALAKHYFSQSYFSSIHNITGAVVFSMGTFWFVTRAMGI
ncbi:HupE/UreJ family protein, partial [Pseudomonadota bacterium]|nr:HupE/UreJ family protein [Pseudomonadota bacterium]